MTHKIEIWSLLRIFLAEAFAAGLANAAVMLLPPVPNVTFVAAITVGMAIYCAIWVTFPVSGAHINPMVSLATVLTRRLHIARLPLYWSAQLVGTLSSIFVTYHLSPHHVHGMTMPGSEVTDIQAVAVETLSTFSLIVVVLAALDELRPESWRIENGNNFPLSIFFIISINIVLTVSNEPIASFILECKA